MKEKSQLFLPGSQYNFGVGDTLVTQCSSDDFSLSTDLADRSFHLYLSPNCSSDDAVRAKSWYGNMGGSHSKTLKHCSNLATGEPTEGHLEREANEKAYS